MQGPPSLNVDRLPGPRAQSGYSDDYGNGPFVGQLISTP
jgi:hypothetical protein